MKFPLPLSASFASAVTLALTLFSTPDVSAQQHSGDPRQEAPKTLNGDFPFTPPATRAEWEARATKLRLQTKVALGLYPLPTRMPLNPVIHGRREMDGYTIEKVYFESVPGFYVTGNLYRPTGVNGPLPGVLCPYGHWDNGRFLRMSDGEVKRDLASGAEVDESTARSPLQARCVHLARMGCVVFHYDMIGCADSIQIPHSLVHLFRAQRPDMNAAEGWGFFSPQAESRLQSIMGLQTWDSIRALDFLTSLPEVDATRIGVTGASGGGTQTFILGAVDPRPAVMFPAVMVSTAMQGGCTCENASLLRMGTGNVELAALFAPKPAGFTTADDWTREFSLKGYPQLQALYKLTGAPDDRTMLHNRPEFPHNYNLPTRLAMYQWMEKHLKTPRPAPAAESPFALLAPEELTVWDAAHPAPKADDKDIERRVLALWDRDAAHQIQGNPSLIDDVLPILAGRTWAEASAGKYSWKPDEDRTEKDGVLRIAGTLIHDTNQETVRCTFFYPSNWNSQVLIRLTESSTAAESSPEVQKALAAGTAVGIPQLFQFPGLREGEIRRVPQDRDFLGYTDGYNPPPLARRAHDILSVLAWMKQHDRKPAVIDIHADAAFVPETALALTQVPDGLVHEAWLASTTFRFANLTNVFDTRLLPGAVKYGDLPALLQRVQADKVVTDAR
ncbi:MAG: acetylxylan esterase [Verrucomicrobiaceae bacterium]|nr:MAG: acetylxylan esterase [Verrucomicrobiaceae bacterium]